MDEAAKELTRQLARRQMIAELLWCPRAPRSKPTRRPTKASLAGRPKLPRMNKTNRLLAAVSALENDRLPGEFQQVQAAPARSVAASARAHAQHHAQPAAVPAGRPAGLQQAAQQAAQQPGPPGGGGDGDTGDGDDDGTTSDGDADDEEELRRASGSTTPGRPTMRPSNQRAFNEKSARAYLNNDVERRAAEGALPAEENDAFYSSLRWIRASRIRTFHAEKRSVSPSPPYPPPVSDRAIT